MISGVMEPPEAPRQIFKWSPILSGAQCTSKNVMFIFAGGSPGVGAPKHPPVMPLNMI